MQKVTGLIVAATQLLETLDFPPAV